MPLEEIPQDKRYYRIDGGDTVLEATGAHWTRWDDWDGPVATSIWTADSPRLTELPEDEAKALIATRR